MDERNELIKLIKEALKAKTNTQLAAQLSEVAMENLTGDAKILAREIAYESARRLSAKQERE